ncbi:hypothetical protein [Sulfurirhabdus autotrophica]|uniref:Uncharacterized protein n=1 Tax=Sulfurirhabdus autotrophica TaxID=1706046 RepID=A0A4R3Y4A5_9PROT|nr:hypothetical protein [Sulfurirhabdus autotrophica]TCV85194.1 hypothetical protein EDC63_11083 [Sulfurirhabdus autotrophica]
MQPCDLIKTREIMFSPLPPNQAEQVLMLLGGLSDIEVELSPHKYAVIVKYDVMHFTLKGIENALIEQNFHLDNSLLQKIKRALAYYCEDIQRHNLKVPERQTKNHQIFVQAYEHHPHGDHDDTPVEWREYR